MRDSQRQDCNVHCPGVDREHDIIARMMSALQHAVSEGRSAEVIGPLADLLTRFCVEHFQHEERLMRECGYLGTDRHAAAHRRLMAVLMKLQEKLRRGQSITDETMGLLHRLAEHTNRWDRAASIAIQKGMTAERAKAAAAASLGAGQLAC
ncbi:MAG: hemerythrin family protein [Bryobacteraceae bacterium]|jgi:hemerythrin-like metal-binding protein